MKENTRESKQCFGLVWLHVVGTLAHKLNHVSYVDGDGRQGNHRNKVCTEYENIYVGRFLVFFFRLVLSLSLVLWFLAIAMKSIHVAVYGPQILSSHCMHYAYLYLKSIVLSSVVF